MPAGVTRHLKKKFQGVNWQSGHFYKFKYQGWRNDKTPHIIFMYAFSGKHPNTGREWRFFQAINMSYVPRAQRKKFMKLYLASYERRKGNMTFVWRDVKTRYPGLRIAVRRYFYSPGYYIINPEEVPFDEAEEFVVGTMLKDFSKKTIRALRQKLRNRKKKSKRQKKNRKAKRL